MRGKSLVTSRCIGAGVGLADLGKRAVAMCGGGRSEREAQANCTGKNNGEHTPGPACRSIAAS